MQDTSEIKYLENWLFVGDGARYTFLKWLMHSKCSQTIKELSQHNIIAEYGPWEEIANSELEWLYCKSPAILPQVGIRFVKGSSESQRMSETVKNIICFEEYPFHKESICNSLQELRGLYPESHICVVLMDLPRKHGYTDLLDEGDDIKQAVNKYSALGYATLIVAGSKDIAKVWAWYEPSLTYWKNKLVRDLESFAEGVQEFEYDFKWQFEDLTTDNGLLSLKIKDSLTNYEVFETAYKDKRPLWQCFSRCAEKELFPEKKEGGVYDFIAIYTQRLVDNNLCFVDASAITDLLIAELRKCYLEKFRRSCFVNVRVSCSMSNTEYYKAISNKGTELYGIVGSFLGMYEEFIKEDIINVFKKVLLAHCKEMRGLLNEK